MTHGCCGRSQVYSLSSQFCCGDEVGDLDTQVREYGKTCSLTAFIKHNGSLQCRRLRMACTIVVKSIHYIVPLLFLQKLVRNFLHIFSFSYFDMLDLL